MLGDFLRGQACITHDDHFVPDGHAARGGTVKTNDPASRVPGDHVGFKARAVINVRNLNLFVLVESRGFHEFYVHRDGAHVI